MSLEKMITIVKKIHHDYNTNPSLFNKNKEKYIKELERNNPGLSRKYSSIFRMFKIEEIDNEKHIRSSVYDLYYKYICVLYERIYGDINEYIDDKCIEIDYN